jgi:hypothetical protein
MTESDEALDTPAKPQDYAGLRTELATLVSDFAPSLNHLMNHYHIRAGRSIATATLVAPRRRIRSEVGPPLGAVNCRNLQLSRPFGPTEYRGRRGSVRVGVRRDSSDEHGDLNPT